MSHLLYKGSIPVVCERPDWRKCPEHKNLTNRRPKSVTDNIVAEVSDNKFLSRDKLGETVITEDEFFELSQNGPFTLHVGVHKEEMIGADWDRLYYIFRGMISGNNFDNNDVITFKRVGKDGDFVLFDVTYERNGFGS